MRLDLSLYLVTDSASERAVRVTTAAARGGASVVQLRDKELSDAVFVERGRALRAALAPLGVPLVVNDRVEAALAIGADGVHVGQSDVSAARVRAALGPEKLVGLSIETTDQLEGLDRDAVDYIGAGPVFATATKPDHAPPIGMDGLAAICRGAPCPAVAIGGLSLAHVAAVKVAGAAGIAVVSAIASAPDPEAAARDLAHAWRTA